MSLAIIARAMLITSIVGLGAGAFAQQPDAPARALVDQPPVASPATGEDAAAAGATPVKPRTVRAGIVLQLGRHKEGSTHFQRRGPRTELISNKQAVDVAVGERAVVGAVAGNSWTLISAGPFNEDSVPVTTTGVVVVSVAAEAPGTKFLLTIDNRLDRVFYVPPIIIDMKEGKASATAGKGCNLPVGSAMTAELSEKALSFVLANVEKTMAAPPCGPDHVLFPETPK